MTQDQREYIEALESRSGKLSPLDVVEAARAKDSPIHGCFDWDDTEAANKWRLEQARELIRRVKIEIQYEETTIRTVKYVRDLNEKPDECGYQNLMKTRKQTAEDIVKAEWSAVLALAKRAYAITQAKHTEIKDGLILCGRAVDILAEIESMTE
jgi:hypothetical protein